MLRFILAAGMLCVAVPVRADDAPANKATVLVQGVHCDACVRALRVKLGSVKGVRLNADEILRGEKPRYFSPPFVVLLGDTLDTGLGALAKATAAADTPHGDDLPPRLNLVLFTAQSINEESVMALRSALREVNGVLVQEAGGLGGFPDRGFYWVRLEPAGGADLKEVFAAARRAVPVSLTK